ncbi:winged helix DNA-binding domain-containing protein [Micromonospora sp. DT81.3]|uniref:winged helix DNA-binding domain-containing protein n=1 Tax=Micromonospora sp. DT81.3 TaxID=3416523 RepID=UPI003CE6E818
MTPARLRALRLRHHRLSAPARTLTDAASHMTATQGQEFWGGRLALAARTAGAPTMADVDAAFDRGELVRSWTMRGTLHIVAAGDLAWILSVTGDRMLRSARKRHADLGLDADVMARAERTLVGALRGGDALSRAEAFEALAAGGVDPSGQRGYHILFALSARTILCWGPVVGRPGKTTREQRVVLIDEWIAEHARPADPLVEFFVRYVQSHGPASPADFAWWAGLPVGMARRALDGAGDRVAPVEVGGETLYVSAAPARRNPKAPRAFVLPPFEEYFISYADRTRVCSPELLSAIGPGINGIVRPVIVADGEIVGTWATPKVTDIPGSLPPATLFARDAVSEEDLTAALARYAAFASS